MDCVDSRDYNDLFSDGENKLMSIDESILQVIDFRSQELDCLKKNFFKQINNWCNHEIPSERCLERSALALVNCSLSIMFLAFCATSSRCASWYFCSSEWPIFKGKSEAFFKATISGWFGMRKGDSDTYLALV